MLSYVVGADDKVIDPIKYYSFIVRGSVGGARAHCDRSIRSPLE